MNHKCLGYVCAYKFVCGMLLQFVFFPFILAKISKFTLRAGASKTCQNRGNERVDKNGEKTVAWSEMCD